jgi:hypothetical protein
MDLNVLLGNGEGAWNYNARKGAEERDRERQAAATLAEIMARTQDIQSRRSMEEQLLPGRMKAQDLDNLMKEVNRQKIQHDLAIGRQFDARTKEGALGAQQAQTDSMNLKTAQEKGNAFLNGVAELVAVKGSATPQEIMGKAKEYGLDQNHVLVQALLNLDPAKQAAALPKTQLSSSAHRQKVDELGIQGQNQARVANIQAGAHILGSQIGADASNNPNKLSSDQLMSKAIREVSRLQVELTRAMQSGNQAAERSLMADLEVWTKILEDTKKARQEERTAGPNATAANQQAFMNSLISRMQEGGQPQGPGPAGIGPQGQGTIVRDFNTLPK